MNEFCYLGGFYVRDGVEANSIARIRESERSLINLPLTTLRGFSLSNKGNLYGGYVVCFVW